MKALKLKASEFAMEFILFNIIGLVYYFAISDSVVQIEDLLISSALWLATIFYRFLFLQIPLAWYLSTYISSRELVQKVMFQSIINFVTFVGIMLFASLFSEVIKEFLEPENLFIPIVVLTSTSLSPITLFFLLNRFAK